MNLHVSATANIVYKFPSGDIPGEVTKYFHLWQTPTGVTRKMLASNDVFDSYIEWVKENSKDKEFPVYDDKDIFCEGISIGTRIYNEGEEHLNDLNTWLETYKEWNIEWFEM